MTQDAFLNPDSRQTVLEWAVARRTPINASVLADGRWCSLRSHLVSLDPEKSLLEIAFPEPCERSAPTEFAPGDDIGIAFRRGHKKCVFVAKVVMRRQASQPTDDPAGTLVVRVPERIRELQRRAYQRFVIPQDRFLPVKLWQGGLPTEEEPAWPLCAGRAGNISLGGILVDIRADQNPRLGVGDPVGVEITTVVGKPPLLLEAQYRHCALSGAGRLGIGLQFVGLEHDVEQRSSIQELADFIRRLQRDVSRPVRAPREMAPVGTDHAS